MDNLTSLAERVEAAGVADRSLDRAIAFELGIGSERERSLYVEMGDAMWVSDRSGLSPLDTARGDRISFKRVGRSNKFEPQRWYACVGPDPLTTCPAYTGSIDAAMSLVPETDTGSAVFWRLGNDGGGGDPALFKAELLVVGMCSHRRYTAVADTPALALCAAALRAREG